MSQEMPIIENPVIGHWYHVPGVLIDRFGYIPIHGPWHEDKEVIKFDRHHYHCDWRFASKRFFDYVWRTVTVPEWVTKEDGKVHNRVITEAMTRWILRRKKCMWPMPDFPNAKWLATFEETYRDHVLSPKCLICPHRGMPLLHGTVRRELPLPSPTEPPVFQNSYRALPFDESSHLTVVCPGHGLKWDLSTGRVVPRGPSPARFEEALAKLKEQK